MLITFRPEIKEILLVLEPAGALFNYTFKWL
jgi:hypothetical protein